MNDIQLVTELQNEGWEIIGSGFKVPRNRNQLERNIELESKVSPLFRSAHFPCICYPGIFWLMQRNDQKKNKYEIRNDVQLLDALRAKSWIVHGAGFKEESTITAKETNEKLMSKWIPWESGLFCPSLDEKEMFWFATRKVADWQVLEE